MRFVGFRKPLQRLISASILVFATTIAGRAEIIPLTELRPVLDGSLDDACWGQALIITNLVSTKTGAGPVQATEVRVCFSAGFLYVGAVCAEADTNLIVAVRPEENDNIWQDDCFEFWVRDPTDNSRFDHFITTPLGVRESHLKPLPNGSKVRPQWKVACALTNGAWVAELAIPFSDFGRDQGPVRGENTQIKFGREDYTLGVDGATYAVWPPGAPYGARGDFGRVSFGQEGFLLNAEMRADTNGVIPHWNVVDIPGFLQSEEVDGLPVGVFSVPGRYGFADQVLMLPRNRMFSVTCETRGTSGGYLRTRTGSVQEGQGMTTLELGPSDDWVPREMLFMTDASGRTILIFGTKDDNAPGVLRVRALAVREETMREWLGQPIPVDPDDEGQVVIKAVRVTDSRAVRGFLGTPVDGTLESWDWALRPWEYNQPGSGAGVKYDYLRNDGLHIKLADTEGINAIQVRGGVRATVVTDCARYDDAASGTTVHQFDGRTWMSLAYFRKPVKSAAFSFFGVRDGVLGDVNFLRVGGREPRAERVARYLAVPETGTPPVWDALSARFRKDGRTSYALVPLPEDGDAASVSGRVDRLMLRAPVHFVTAAADREIPVSAISVRGRWTRTPPDALLTLQVQDPTHPFSAMATASVKLESRGDMDLIFDFPDQVLKPGQRLWLSLVPNGSLTVEDLSLSVYEPTRAEAVADALPYQMLRLKGYFVPMSESRPWTQLRYRGDLRKSWRTEYEDLWRGLEPMFNALETARRLDPADPLAAEYDRWFFRASSARAGQSVLNPVALLGEAGAPEWAVAARAAWMHSRTVPKWWLDNRLVPTGEFGTELNDDTDLWQNFANFPMFERDGVAGELLVAGQQMWDLAVRGGYLEGGINATQEDPLHAYEEGINHEGMMLWWAYGDPVHVEQCMVAARSTEALTTVNAAGHRHFKTRIVSAADLRNTRANESDGYNHALLMHPVQEVVWYNKNPRALQFLTAYCDSWLAHMHRPDAYATEVDTTTDEVLESSYEPFMDGMSFQMGVMLTAAEAHRDTRFIQPAINFFRAQSQPDFLRSYVLDFYEQGYLGDLTPLRPYLYKLSPAITWRETGDKGAMIQELLTEVAEIQTFPNMYTTAEPFTDRVFLEPRRRLNSSALAYTGGFSTRNRSRHSHAVSWDGFGTNYAAFVRAAGRDALRTLVYNFSDQPVTGRVRFWRLDHGEYLWASGVDEDGDDAIDRDTVATTLEVVRGQAVPLTLAPRAVTVLRLSKLRDLDPLEERADLALSRSEVAVVGENVRGLAHNIGSRDVADVVVALIDAQGAVRSQASLGSLAAPLDLAPRRTPFTIGGLPESHAGWQVVLDPERVVAEITEENNAVTLP